MMQDVKIFHTGDLHYCQEHLEEVDRCFGFAVDGAIASQCDVAIIAGDTFDHRLDLHSPAVAAVLAQVRRLADAMPVIILQGTYSHDAPGSLDVFKTLGGKHPVIVADRIAQIALWKGADAWTYRISNGWIREPGFTAAPPTLLVSCLPSVNKGAVAAALGCEGAAQAVGDQVADLLAGWAPSHLAARAQGTPTFVVSHGTVSGSITEHGVPMVGLDHEYTAGTLFAAEASAVLLNHIHQYQEWEKEGRRIAYSGSIGRLHFGELTDKGFLIWKVGAAGATADFVPTPAKRLIQIEFEGLPDMESLARVAADAAGAHVRIRYQVDEEHRHAVDRKAIQAMFTAAAICKIEPRVNPVQRVRAAGISRAPSLEDKLVQWGEVTSTETDPLRERLAQVQNFEPEQIVARLMEAAS